MTNTTLSQPLNPKRKTSLMNGDGIKLLGIHIEGRLNFIMLANYAKKQVTNTHFNKLLLVHEREKGCL